MLDPIREEGTPPFHALDSSHSSGELAGPEDTASSVAPTPLGTPPKFVAEAAGNSKEGLGEGLSKPTLGGAEGESDPETPPSAAERVEASDAMPVLAATAGSVNHHAGGDDGASDGEGEVATGRGLVSQQLTLGQVCLQLIKMGGPFTIYRIVEYGAEYGAILWLGRLDRNHLAAASLIVTYENTVVKTLGSLLFSVGGTMMLTDPADSTQAGFVLAQAVKLAMVATALAAPLLICAEPILNRIGQSHEITEIVRNYMQAYAYGLPAVFLFVAGIQGVVGVGQHTKMMLFGLVHRAIYLFLASGFISGKMGFPRLGSCGLGYASTLSYYAAVIMLYSYMAYSKKFGGFRGFMRSLVGGAELTKQLIKTGLPIAAYVGTEFGILFYGAALLGTLGKDALASEQPALQYASWLITIVWSFTFATYLFVNQTFNMSSLGDQSEALLKNRIADVTTCIKATFMILGATQVLLTASIVAAQKYPVEIFLDNHKSSPQFVKTAQYVLYFGLLQQLCNTGVVISYNTLRGLGIDNFPVLVNAITTLSINMPLSFVFSSIVGWKASGVFIGDAIATFLVMCILLAKSKRTVSQLTPASVVKKANEAAALFVESKHILENSYMGVSRRVVDRAERAPLLS